MMVVWPILGSGTPEHAAPEGDESGLDALDEEIDQTLRAIKEIDFDRESGHLSGADFQALDREERARAIELMRRRDALSATSDAGAAHQSASETGVPPSE